MPDPVKTQTITAIIITFCTMIQTFAILVAGWLAWRAFKQTQLISDEQKHQTDKIHLEQKALTKNQTFISLFEHLKTMRDIIPTNPCWEDVSDSANLLELIAIAWHKKLVSQKLLRTVYGEMFVRVYEQIEQSIDKDTGEERGKKILYRDCVAAIRLYPTLKKLVHPPNPNIQTSIAKGALDDIDTRATKKTNGKSSKSSS